MASEDLSLNRLAELGCFAGKIVKKEITFKNGDDDVTVDVYVKPLSYAATVAALSAGEDGDQVAERIAASIVDSNGKQIFTAGDITGEANPERGALNGSLTFALLAAIGEVNGLGKSQKTTSGTS